MLSGGVKGMGEGGSRDRNRGARERGGGEKGGGGERGGGRGGEREREEEKESEREKERGGEREGEKKLRVCCCGCAESMCIQIREMSSPSQSVVV